MVELLHSTLNWIAQNKMRGGVNNEKKSTITQKQEREQQVNDGLPMIDLRHIQIGRCLGKGQYSKVYKINRISDEKSLLSPLSSTTALSKISLPVKQNKKTKKYALKVLRNSTLRSEVENVKDAKIDMKNEIKVLSTLNHENILNIYGCGSVTSSSSSNNIFLIIDQIEITLHEQIVKWRIINNYDYDYDHFFKYKKQETSNLYGSYSDYCDLVDDNDTIGDANKDKIDKYHSWLLLKEKINIAEQIVDAIRYMHDCRFVYRDLKPTNTGLLHSNDPSRATEVKLFDFGTCRELPSQSSSHECYKMSFVGSPRYMAPEIHGLGKYNEKADVYSWSILLYEMLTLERAYPTYEIQEYYMRVYRRIERPRLNDSYLKREILNLCREEIRYDLSIPEEIKDVLKCSWEGNICKRYSSCEVQQKLRSSSLSRHSELQTRSYHGRQRQLQQYSEVIDNTANETESSFY